MTNSNKVSIFTWSDIGGYSKKVIHLSYVFFLLIFAGLCLFATAISFPSQGVFEIRKNYDKAEYMIPMRDGTKLYTMAQDSCTDIIVGKIIGYIPKKMERRH